MMSARQLALFILPFALAVATVNFAVWDRMVPAYICFIALVVVICSRIYCFGRK